MVCALKAGGSRSISVGRATFRNGLVVAQVALSLVLMIALGLLFRSYVRMQGIDPGFDPESVLTFELSIPELRYDTQEKAMQVWSTLHQRIVALPGAISVGSIDRLPVRDGGIWNYIHAADSPPATPADRMEAERRLAAPGLFRTLGVPLLAGRAISDADRPGVPPVVVINQALAEQFFPGGSPLGRKLVLPWDPEIRMEVIGVVGDLMEHGPETVTPPTFYMAAWQRHPLTMQFAVRTAGNPLASVAALRAAVRDFDADIPLSQVATMSSRIDRYHGDSIFRASLVGLFAVVALLLTAIGLYGVMVYFVRQRAREISIRLALGARTADIFSLVVGRGMAMVGLGVVAGVAGGLGVARFMRNLLFGIAPNDAATYGAVSICLAMVALLACLLPARRAMKLDPADALKAE